MAPQEFDQQINNGETRRTWLTVLGYALLVGSVPACLWIAGTLMSGR